MSNKTRSINSMPEWLKGTPEASLIRAIYDSQSERHASSIKRGISLKKLSKCDDRSKYAIGYEPA